LNKAASAKLKTTNNHAIANPLNFALALYWVDIYYVQNKPALWSVKGAHGGAVGSGTAVQAGSIPDGVVGIFH
jgi:hypothetical protein